MPDIEPVDLPLARMFAALWQAFQTGVGIDAMDVETLIDRTGLAVWLPATEDDVKAPQYEGLELDVGDMLLKLTEEGRAVVRAGRR